MSFLLVGILAASLFVPASAATDEGEYYIQQGTWTQEDQLRSSGISLSDTFDESDFLYSDRYLG